MHARYYFICIPHLFSQKTDMAIITTCSCPRSSYIDVFHVPLVSYPDVQGTFRHPWWICVNFSWQHTKVWTSLIHFEVFVFLINVGSKQAKISLVALRHKTCWVWFRKRWWHFVSTNSWMKVIYDHPLNPNLRISAPYRFEKYIALCHLFKSSETDVDGFTLQVH